MQGVSPDLRAVFQAVKGQLSREVHGELIEDKDILFYLETLSKNGFRPTKKQFSKTIQVIRRCEQMARLFSEWDSRGERQRPRIMAMKFNDMCGKRTAQHPALLEYLVESVRSIWPETWSTSDAAREQIALLISKVGQLERDPQALTRCECLQLVKVVMNFFLLLDQRNISACKRIGFTELICNLRKIAHEEDALIDESDFKDNVDELLTCFHDRFDNSDELCDRFRLWQIEKNFLKSSNLHEIVSKHVRLACRKNNNAKDSLKDFVDDLDVKMDAELLAFDLKKSIAILCSRMQPFPSDNKMQDEGARFCELKLDNLQHFHDGLEKRIGYPVTASIMEVMKRAHEEDELLDRDGQKKINPKVEWNIVIGEPSSKWIITNVEDKPERVSSDRSVEHGLSHYVKLCWEKIRQHREPGKDHPPEDFVYAEVAALRLWTGPMYMRYAQIYRGECSHQGQGTASISVESKRVLLGYVTLLHAINSGITRLAQLWRLPSNRTLYRGYKRLTLDIKTDKFGCRGGVEPSVLATSEDFEVAMSYSTEGFILELEVGQVDRGADISWLSQFPHQKEILFNALSNLELVGQARLHITERGSVRVYHVRVNSNLKSKTLEDFQSLRKDLHMASFRYLLDELSRTLDDYAVKHNAQDRMKVEPTQSLMSSSFHEVVSFTSSIRDDCMECYEEHARLTPQDFALEHLYRKVVNEMLEVKVMALSKLSLWLEAKEPLYLVREKSLYEAHQAFLAFLRQQLQSRVGKELTDTAVHLCKMQGLIQENVDEKTEVQILTKNGEDVIFGAATDGKASLDFQLLFMAGVEVNGFYREFQSPLCLCAQGGHVNILIALLEKKADIDSIDQRTKQTAIMKAAFRGHTETVALLLDSKADVNSANLYRYSILMMATTNGHDKTVGLLLDRKANVHATDSCGNTAIDMARRGRRNDLVELLQNEAAVHLRADKETLRDYDRDTALQRTGDGSTTPSLAAAGTVSSPDLPGEGGVQGSSGGGGGREDLLGKILAALNSQTSEDSPP